MLKFVYLTATQTVAMLYSFLLAMVLYPEAQKRAQDEIDALTERGRIPTLRDREHLPFIDCIIKEIFRWAPPTPIGMLVECISVFSIPDRLINAPQ